MKNGENWLCFCYVARTGNKVKNKKTKKKKKKTELVLTQAPPWLSKISCLEEPSPLAAVYLWYT